ncbi:MAG: hypothetical protein COA82_06235 [Alkaliphilus sp.]|nr:DUF4321 domain-containing protein [bacterium AH-315-E09]PHS34981.1 MAG: hypothetical protein COA82_06235 [Alkaliphilus sp.]
MKKYGNPWLLLLLLVTGFVLGSVIAMLLGDFVPMLSYGPGSLGIEDFEVNLGFVFFSITFLANINLAGIIGLVLAIIIFNKL